jgi:hypothetical protein
MSWQVPQLVVTADLEHGSMHEVTCTHAQLLAESVATVVGAIATAALDWVVRNATRPAVATLSLGIPVGGWSRALEAATRRVLAAGILVVVAAGVPLHLIDLPRAYIPWSVDSLVGPL